MLLVAAMLALSWTVAAVGEAQTSPRTVILDAPGALEALQRSNPAHFHKVQKILDGLLQQQAADVPRWIEVSFGARNVSYVPVVLMSYPAKRRLSFVLDQTPYEAMLTVRNFNGEIVPLRPPSDLKSVPASQRVTSLGHCQGTYKVLLKDGSTRKFNEYDLAFKVDTSGNGPTADAPALVPTGRVGTGPSSSSLGLTC